MTSLMAWTFTPRVARSADIGRRRAFEVASARAKARASNDGERMRTEEVPATRARRVARRRVRRGRDGDDDDGDDDDDDDDDGERERERVGRATEARSRVDDLEVDERMNERTNAEVRLKMNRRQKYVTARNASSGTSAVHRERKMDGEMDLRATRSSHGAVSRHVNATKGASGIRGGDQVSGSGKNAPMRAGERIVLAMESIDAPAAGERIAWDVVAQAVNPEGAQFKFSTSTLNFAIKELGERGSFDRALALYSWMSRKRGKFAPNEFTYVALAGAAQSLGNVRTVQTIWRRVVETGEDELVCNEIASAVIAALNRVSDWSGAYQVFKDMRDKGKARNLYTYTAVLTALRDESKADEALAVLNDMRTETGVQPTSLAFALTLSAFDNSRRWIEGNALALRIKQYDVRPDTTLMHAIITMAGRAGDMAHASDVFNTMRQSTMIVTTYTFNALLGGYARYGDWQGCVDVYDEMKRSRLQPDSYTFTQLISAAERSGEYIAADGVWAEMLRARIIPHTVMCGAYIHCLGCQSRDLEAEAVMEKMRNFWDVPRNAAVYNALIGAHVRSGEITRALGVLEEMQRIDGLMPTEITFAVLIRACQESALTKRAADLESTRDALANAGQLIQDLSGVSSLS